MKRSTYLEPDEFMLAIGQTVQDYGWSLEIDHILGRLNSGAAFDFELIPQKHDELTIFYKDKWGSENRQRFFYSDGEWVDYKSPSVDTIIEQRIFKKGCQLPLVRTASFS